MTRQTQTLASVLMAGVLILFQGCKSTRSSTTPPPMAVALINDINGGLSGSGTVGSIFLVDRTDSGAPNSGRFNRSADANYSVCGGPRNAKELVKTIKGTWNNQFLTFPLLQEYILIR
jgi:hypothetical protein